jgi:riboflavin synthase alpha subunit
VTWNETALRFRKAGDFVNLEADLIGKYVCHQLQRMLGRGPETVSDPSSGRPLTMDDLREAGFQ